MQYYLQIIKKCQPDVNVSELKDFPYLSLVKSS